MRYAWIENGVVTNIIALNDRNASDFPTAVKLGDRPVGIGDTYADGKFYRDSEDGKLYLCQRTGEASGGTVVLQYLPHELVGQYFVEVI